jgi:hypothetical protein
MHVLFSPVLANIYMLAEARSASFSSSSLWFYCFAARFEWLEKMNPFNHH